MGYDNYSSKKKEAEMIWGTKNSNNWIWGLLAGAAVGTLIGLLFAPKKGKYLRADIARTTGRLTDDAEEYLEHAKSKATDLASDIKRGTERIAKGAQKAASSIIDKVTP
jgi:gas vesicle protein